MANKKHLKVQMIFLVVVINAIQVNPQGLGGLLGVPVTNILNTLTGNSGNNQYSNTQYNNRVDHVQYYDVQYRPQQQPQDSSNQFYNTQQQTVQSACGDYWSIQHDHTGNAIGVITLRNPDRNRNELKVTLTVVGRLPSVNIQYMGSFENCTREEF